jgi:hypothetical protein
LPDKLYFILKLTAAMVSALYGFYATVTDFRVERNGHKVLSRKGYFGLALLVFATAVSLSTDTSKERRDDKAAADTSDALKTVINEGKRLQTNLEATSDALQRQVTESQAIAGKLSQTGKQLEAARSSIEKDIATSGSILRQTNRLSDPIKRDGVELSVSIEILDQPLLRPYHDRIKGRHGGHVDERIEPGDEDFPDYQRPQERALAELVNFQAVDVSFGGQIREIVGHRVVEQDKDPSFLLDLRGRCDKGALRDDEFYDPGSNVNPKILKQLSVSTLESGGVGMNLYCSTSDVRWKGLEGGVGVRSWYDLRKTTGYVQIHLANLPPGPAETASDSRVKYGIISVEATRGNDSIFNALDLEEPCSHPTWEACFPGSLIHWYNYQDQ